MPNLSIRPSFPIFTDKNGSALESGYIYVGTAGLDAATNAIAIYFDAALTIPATQPVRTVAGYPDNNGTKAMLYTAATDFSLTVADKNNVTVYSALNITDETYKDAGQSAQISTNTTNIATNTANIATNTSNISTNTTKLATIETGADVTDAANVNAAGATMNTDTSLAGNSYFLDEDTMASDDATKVPSQQSVKAYVQSYVSSNGGVNGTKGVIATVSTTSGTPDQIAIQSGKILQLMLHNAENTGGRPSSYCVIDSSDDSFVAGSNVGNSGDGSNSGTVPATSFGSNAEIPSNSTTEGFFIRKVSTNYEIYHNLSGSPAWNLTYIWL